MNVKLFSDISNAGVHQLCSKSSFNVEYLPIKLKLSEENPSSYPEISTVEN